MDKMKNRIISTKEKLEIMQKFVEQTGEEIKTKTVFEDYPIGTWKQNLRSRDFKGKLDIDSQLREEFEKIGVLGERQRKKRTTDKEKYDTIISLFENGSAKEREVYVKEQRYWLQRKYAKGELQLSDEEISKLIELDIISPIVEKPEDKYGISKFSANYIFLNYGNIDKFIEDYKKGIIQLSDEELRFASIKLPNKITICSHDITIEDKIKFVNFIKDISRYCSRTKIGIYEEASIINIDAIEDIINKLPEGKRDLLCKFYGFCGMPKIPAKQLAEKRNYMSTYAIYEAITNIKRHIWNNILLDESQNNITKFQISSQNMKIIKALEARKNKLEKIINNAINSQSARDIKYLGISEKTQLELRKNNIYLIRQLMQFSDDELSQLSLSEQSLKEIIIRRKAVLTAQELEEKKLQVEEIKKQIQDIRQREKEKYDNAVSKSYNHIMQEEDIFNPSGIVPASIESKEEALHSVDEEQEDKLDYNNMEIENLHLSTRAYNVLKKNGILTLGPLISMTERELANLSGSGEKTVEAIKNCLKSLNLSLAEEIKFSNKEISGKNRLVKKEFDDLKIENLGLPYKVVTKLKRMGIYEFKDLISLTEGELTECKGIGEKTINEILRKLELLGLSLPKKGQEIPEVEQQRLSQGGRLNGLMKEKRRKQEEYSQLSAKVDEQNNKIDTLENLAKINGIDTQAESTK